jgi:hypothetical protein
MKFLRIILSAVVATILFCGPPLVGGGCTCGGSQPAPPTVSPYEQAKESFDQYKNEYLSRKSARPKGGARSK